MRSIIASVQAQAARLREALLGADLANLQDALAGAEGAAHQLQALAESGAPANAAQPGLRADLLQLRAELERAAHLALGGQELCRQWFALYLPDAAGGASYTAQGAAVPVAASGALSVEG